MKTNPFLLALIALGAIGVLVGVVITIMIAVGNVPMRSVETMSSIAGLLLAIGGPALAGAGVLAGIEWRQRQP